jgi:hypothetical protein
MTTLLRRITLAGWVYIAVWIVLAIGILACFLRLIDLPNQIKSFSPQELARYHIDPANTRDSCKPIGTHARPLIIIGCFSGFVLGAVLRRWKRARGTRGAIAALPATRTALKTLYSGIIFGFFLLGFFLLRYETQALSSPPEWPITSYIRCASVIYPWAAGLMASAVCCLVGHCFA